MSNETVTTDQLRQAISDLEAYVREEFGHILERDVDAEKNRLENSTAVKAAVGLFVFMVIVNLFLLLHLVAWDSCQIYRSGRSKR